jgi:probable addiction module antidote protein
MDDGIFVPAETHERKVRVSHDEAIIRRLRKGSDFAAEYLKAAPEDEDEPRVLLIALRHLAEAQGIAKVAKAAGIERESLYRALSVRGNPRLSTLVAVTKAIGLRLTVEARKATGVPNAGERVPNHFPCIFTYNTL